MGIKKSYKKLAMASACALAVGWAVNVQAAVDYKTCSATDVADAVTINYADELDVGTDLEDKDGVDPVKDVQDIIFQLNGVNTIPASTDVRVTLTLGNGAFFAAPPAAIYNDTTGDITFTLLTGGGTTDSMVIFTGTMDATNGAAVNTDPFEIDMNGIIAADHGDISVTIKVQTADNFGPTTVNTFTGNYLTFQPALVTTFTPTATPDLIDVTQDSFFFDNTTGDVDIVLGNVACVFTTRLNHASAALANADAILSQMDVTLSNPGGWAAFDQAGVACTDGTNDYVISGTDTAFTYTTVADIAGAGLDVTCTVPAENTVTIESGDVSAASVGTAAAAKYLATTGTTTGSLASFEKNGTTATSNFLLTPGGVYNNFVRISNTSSVAGDVYLKLYQDDGTVSSVFQLSDIDATMSDELAAQASTNQMTLQQIFDASGLTAGYTGKLRLEAEGEFSSISIQAYTISTDGTTFSTF